MLAFTRTQLLSSAVVGAVALVVGASSASARSDEPLEYLGPVGPHQPILMSVGNKRIIAFYEPGDRHCNVYVVANDRSDDSGASAEQVRVSLTPHQIVHVDTTQNKSLSLQCGENAATLGVVR